MTLQDALIELFNSLNPKEECLDDGYTLDPGCTGYARNTERDEVLYREYHVTHYGYRWLKKGVAEVTFYKNDGFGAASGGPVVKVVKLNKRGKLK